MVSVPVNVSGGVEAGRSTGSGGRGVLTPVGMQGGREYASLASLQPGEGHVPHLGGSIVVL